MDFDTNHSESLGDSEETFPLHPFLSHFRNSPQYKRTGTDVDFPILQNLNVRHALGNKGKPFGTQIKRELYWDTINKKLVGAIWFPYTCEGPPGSVHGGAIATALDSCLGYTTLRGLGLGYVTLYLNTNYRNFIRLGSIVKVECDITKVDGKKVYLHGKLSNDDDTTIHSEADALFYLNTPSPTFETAQQQIGPQSGMTADKLISNIKEIKKAKKAKKKEKANLKAKL